LVKTANDKFVSKMGLLYIIFAYPFFYQWRAQWIHILATVNSAQWCFISSGYASDSGQLCHMWHQLQLSEQLPHWSPKRPCWFVFPGPPSSLYNSALWLIGQSQQIPCTDLSFTVPLTYVSHEECHPRIQTLLKI
jgi:hypothetical protein